ncbi:MAG TPA: carboxypeptidase-like regulatory domain-containing protein [Bryobacteraceae bacterium]|jgi:hypothetical protein|nr:carboxypeptidase-like regulatory domain-containing protein [Bryobacteraceae bacterium]
MRGAVQLSAALILLCLPCVAQYEIRSVAGTVTDKRGNALPGAAVQLESSRTLAVMSHITDKDGVYRFNLLSSDSDYSLKAKYGRNWSRQRTLSKFNSSRHPTIDLVIPID